MNILYRLIMLIGFIIILPDNLPAGVVERISVVTFDSSVYDISVFSPEVSLSADGRYIAFTSTLSNLVIGDTNGVADVMGGLLIHCN